MTAMASAQKGIIAPTIDAHSARFWQGLEHNVIRLPQCDACHTVWFPPTPACPECGSQTSTEVEAARTGRVYSWVVVHRSLHEEFADELPYVVATVALDGGPRIFARLFDIAIDAIEADQQVEAVFYTVAGFRLLGFRPQQAEASKEESRTS